MNRLISERDKVDTHKHTHTSLHSHENFLETERTTGFLLRDNWPRWLPGSGGEFAGCRVCESSMSRLILEHMQEKLPKKKKKKEASAEIYCQDSGEAEGRNVLAGTQLAEAEPGSDAPATAQTAQLLGATSCVLASLCGLFYTARFQTSTPFKHVCVIRYGCYEGHIICRTS